MSATTGDGETDILGIFDSGLGGLTVLRAVRSARPDADILYYADQAHVPYGDRSTEELAVLLRRNVAYLKAHGVSAIVMGCNTSCSVARARGWPSSGVPIFDLIDGVADELVRTRVRRVGILGTAATIRSGAYGRAIRERDGSIDVQESPAPELVPLVERGFLNGPIARAAVERACAPFAPPLDALVLACTHYPLLDLAFASVLPGVPRVDPAQAQAARAAAFLAGRRSRGTGRTLYVTTGDVGPYIRAVTDIVGERGPHDTFAHAPPLGSSVSNLTAT